MSNNFANFFNTFQGQNGQAQQMQQQQQQQQPQPQPQPQQQQLQPNMNAPSTINLGGSNIQMPPGVTPEMLRAMMHQWQQQQQQRQQISQQNQTSQMQQSTPAPQQQQQQNFFAGIPQNFRPNNMTIPGQQNNVAMQNQNFGVGNVGNSSNFAANLQQQQQTGAISGAQAAAAASQAAALTRQQQMQIGGQASTSAQQQTGQNRNDGGNVRPPVAGQAPTSLQQAMEMARNGTLPANQLNTLRTMIEAHRANPNMNPQLAAALMQQMQQQQQQQQRQNQPTPAMQQQNRPPTFTPQMMNQANLLQLQQNNVQQQQQQQQPQQPAQGNASVLGGGQQQPAMNARPAQIYKALEARISDTEARLATLTDVNQRMEVGKQLQDAKKMKEAMTAHFALELQMQQQAQQQGKAPAPQQQSTPQMQARPSPRPNNANVFSSPAFPQQQTPRPLQQQQFATLNQSPHLGATNSMGLQQGVQQQQQQQTPQLQPQPAVGQTPRPPGMLAMKPDQFMRAVSEHMTQRSLPFQHSPVINNQRVDLYRLFQAVQAQGGSNAVTTKNAWPTIALQLELAVANHPRYFEIARELETVFRSQLGPFEEVYMRAAQYQFQYAQQQAARQRMNQQQQQQQQTATQPTVQNNVFTGDLQSQLMQAQAQQQQQGGQMSLQQAAQFARPPASTAQQGSAPGSLTINLNGKPVTLGAPPILPPERLAEMNTTQEKFAAAHRQQQLHLLQQQMKLAAQQQQQQAGQGQQQQQGIAGANFPLQMLGGDGQITPQQQSTGFPGQQQQQQQLQQLQQQMQQQLAQQRAGGGAGLAQQPNSNVAPRPPNAGQQSAPQQETSQQQRPRFIPVSHKQLEEARAVMSRIDEELSHSRPRLTLNTTMPEAEREEVLNEVAKSSWLLDTVKALLPVFYAMQSNLEPAKRLMIMTLMLQDQVSLLPSRQCILRKSDLDKLKMQMSRCIHYVRTSNPTMSTLVLAESEKAKNESRMRLAEQQQQSFAQQLQPAFGGSTTDENAALNIKRQLRVEDLHLKQPPQKKGKGAAATSAKAGSSPAAVAIQASPKIKGAANESSPNSAPAKGKRGAAASTAANAKNKKRGSAQGRPGTQDGPAKGRGGKGASATTPADPGSVETPADATPSSKSTTQIGDSVDQAWAAIMTEKTASSKDPAAFAEAAWQDLLSGNGQSALPTDEKALQSLFSLLGQQQNTVGILPNATIANDEVAAAPQATALDQADAQVDIDLLDFIDMDALGPDSAVDDPEKELESLLATSHSSSASILGDTPELVDSSRASSSTTSSSLNKKLNANLDLSAWNNASPASTAMNGQTENDDGDSTPANGLMVRAPSSASTSTSPVNDALSKLTGLGEKGQTPDDEASSKAVKSDDTAIDVSQDDWWDKSFDDASQQNTAQRPWAVLS